MHHKNQLSQAFFLMLLFSQAFFGCGYLTKQTKLKTFPKKVSSKKTQTQEKQTWKNIQNKKYKSLSYKIKDIEAFIQDNKDKDVVLEAYLLKAELYSKNKKYKQACLSYHQIVRSSFNYVNQWPAYQKSAQCDFNQKKIRLAVETLEAFIQNPTTTKTNKKKAAQKQWRFLKNQKAFPKWKLVSLSHIFSLSESSKEKEFWKNQGEAFIRTASPSELILYADQASLYGVFEGYLLYKAGTYFFKNKELNRSKHYFKKSLLVSLSLSLEKKVKNRLKLIQTISKVNPYLIGVLVPLSGHRKALGEKILRGIYMGLELEQDSSWQIIVMDSKSHPDVVRSHLDNLFYKHHVIGLIGGLTSETAKVIAQKAEDFATPAILFSQKKDLSLNRSFVFQNAITAKQIVTPLVQHVQKALNIKRVAVLYPDDSYGKEYAKTFSNIFKEKGGKIKGYESYKTGEVDFKIAIKNLLHLNPKGREEEYEQLKQEFLKQNPSVTERSRKLLPENFLPIKMEFQAVFIPDTLDQLKKIKDHLQYFGVKKIYLLGTDIWRPRQIPKWPEKLPLVFINLLDKNLATIQRTSFYKKFLKSYNYSPGLFEQRAYNVAVFLKLALSQGLRSRLVLQNELQKIKQFQGAYYKISISEDQVFQYPLSIYKQRLKGHKLDSVPVK